MSCRSSTRRAGRTTRSANRSTSLTGESFPSVESTAAAPARRPITFLPTGRTSRSRSSRRKPTTSCPATASSSQGQLDRHGRLIPASSECACRRTSRRSIDAIRRYCTLLQITFSSNVYKVFETPKTQILRGMALIPACPLGKPCPLTPGVSCPRKADSHRLR